MSVLAHWCRACDHQTDWHDSRNRSYTPCSCCRAGTPDSDPNPVMHQTFSTAGGEVEPLVAPGQQRNAGTMHATVTCSCQACHAAYALLVTRGEIAQ